MRNTRYQYIFTISIIGILFFLFGFVTWLNGALIPFLKTACQLNDFSAYLVTFAFYISYFVMAIPSSKILEKIGFRNGITLGLFVMSIGAAFFIPAAISRNYLVFLIGLFTMGTGLALLQTAVNPYVTIIGPIESAAKRISIMGISNKFAGVLAPVLLASIVLKDAEEIKFKLSNVTDIIQKNAILDDLAQRLILPYIFMSIFLSLLALMVRLAHLPEINTEDNNENTSSDDIKHNKGILKFPHLILGVVALFFYVGVEVIAGDTIIRYGESIGVSMSSAKYFTSLVLIGMIIGYLMGIIFIPKYISQSKALAICSILGLIFTIAAIFVDSSLVINLPFIDLTTFKAVDLVLPYSVLFLSLLGIANSLVWPAIWPLSLNGLGKYTKLGSALLIMSIAGGATLPLVYGWLADTLKNTQQAYSIAIICYLVILYYSIWGYKKNKFFNSQK